MKKRMLFFMFIFCLSMFGLWNLTVEAAGNTLKISVSPGFDGKVKSGHGLPIQVTVENLGNDFSGDLLFNFSSSYSSSGAKVIPIDVPKGSKKTYTSALPGFTEDYVNAQNKHTIFLYKGSWKDGHEQSFIGDKSLKLKMIDPTYQTLGILSEAPDRLKELKVLPSNNNVETIVLKEEMISEDELGLDSLDYLVIDEYGLAKLKAAQQKAIIAWIQNGGTLIAGASPNAAQQYGILYPVLPMKTAKEASADTKFLQVSDEQVSFKSIPVFIGDVDKDAEIAVKSGDLPAVLHKRYGLGDIWQITFSLGDEPLSSWKEYGKWFADTLLHQQNVNSKYVQKFGSQADMFNEIVRDNEYFPTTHFTLGQISLMLLVYILLAAPVLYLILRKLDKREHAWWIIISFALLTSIGIFSIGAKGRLAKPQMNQIGVFQAEDNRLNGLGAVSFLSNTGGDYQLSFSKGKFNGFPGGTGISGGDGRLMAVMEGANNVTFPNVEYWSLRSYVGQVSKENTGQFDINLKYENKQLSGEITNHFPYDFENLVIWTGASKVNLGGLKKGETLKVSKGLQQDILTAPITGGGPSYPTLTTYQEVEKMKKENMEFTTVEFLYNRMDSRNQPILFGYTKSPIIQADIKGKKELLTSLNLIYQPLIINWTLNGSFTMQDAMFGKHLNVIRGGILNEISSTRNQKELDDGEYEYVLKAPKQLFEGKAVLNELVISWSGSNLTYSILNNSTGSYIPLKDSNNTIKDHIDQYIGKDGTIIIKLIKSGQGNTSVTLPTVLLKGDMTHD